MKPKRRMRDITLFLAVSVGAFCACYCVLSLANNYYLARYNLDVYTQDLQGWEACRQTRPSYYRANTDAVNSCLKGLDVARENFWVNLSTGQLAGLLVLAGLGGAAGGYLSTWAAIWFSYLAIHKFASLLVRWIRGTATEGSQNTRPDSERSEESPISANQTPRFAKGNGPEKAAKRAQPQPCLCQAEQPEPSHSQAEHHHKAFAHQDRLASPAMTACPSSPVTAGEKEDRKT